MTRCETYLPAFVGAVIAGIIDLLNNSRSAMVVKFGEMVREYLVAQFEYGALLAFVLLPAIAIGLAYVRQPQTRADSFGLGLSIFAVFSVVTPYQGGLEPTTGLLPSLVSPAYAAEAPSAEAGRQIVLLSIASADTSRPVRGAFVALREDGAARVVAVDVDEGEIVKVSAPDSGAALEVEAEGFRRAAVPLDLKRQRQRRYTVTLEPSGVPLSLQRVVQAEVRELTAVFDAALPPDTTCLVRLYEGYQESRRTVVDVGAEGVPLGLSASEGSGSYALLLRDGDGPVGLVEAYWVMESGVLKVRQVTGPACIPVADLELHVLDYGQPLPLYLGGREYAVTVERRADGPADDVGLAVAFEAR